MTKFLVLVSMILGLNLAQAIPMNKVQVGGEADMDACGGYGIVLATTTIIDFDYVGEMTFNTVNVNTRAYSCDADDEYVGLVYGTEEQDCGVSSPIKNRQPYQGPCKSGWIKKSFFELLAG